ncbi:hypothetical protein HWV62_17324 [Athelia sp. TMB]|nr:hypothetical protein HWV62_17324 [Athelia sp. TMB]
MSIPIVQKSWKIVRKGKPSAALFFDKKAAVPSQLKPGEVLIQVKAAALNPVGYKLMQMLPNILSGGRPYPAEHDLSGVIVDIHKDTKTELKVGDSVFGYIEVELQRKTQQGAITQYTRMPASCLAPLPPTVSFTEAAGFTLAGQTAWQGLFQVGKVEPGQTILVNGGSSSVGGFAIQMAKAKGCKVVATASSKNEEYFIDYTAGPLHQALITNPPSPKFHVIFDAVGLSDSSLYKHSRLYLAPNGCYVSVSPNELNAQALGLLFHGYLRPRWLGGVPAAFRTVFVRHSKDDLYAIRDLIAEGKLKPTVDSVFALEDTLKAYERIMSHRARGKVVIRVDPDAE